MIFYTLLTLILFYLSVFVLILLFKSVLIIFVTILIFYTFKMILGKYQIIKRLGKGAFGEVVLAEDSNNKKYAIKMIPFKSFVGDNAYLLEYLESQIKCLKELHSDYVMKLYKTDEDGKFKYMICEYCDGGDLITVQSKQPNRVFPLDKATEILSFIIKGLYSLHDAGYVHRDIKAENILMKTENGKEIYKLGDFGFTKNIKDISYTILGTGAYMSPELYSEEQYGFEVDMWAFGVLFYFMLNMEFPFKANMAPKTKKKSEELIKIATDFSYKKFVEGSRKKILTNCTSDIEDLFKKIFNPNPKQRINFHAIKSHPVFSKYFTEKQDNQSKILYTTRSKNLKTINPKHIVKEFFEKNAKPMSGFVSKPSKILESSQDIFSKQKAKVQFLKSTLVEIEQNADLPSAQLLSLKFNVQKYIIMLLKNLQKTLNQKKNSSNKESRWTNFFKSKEFTYNQKDLQQEIKKSEFQMEKIYDNCEDNLKSIIQVNKYFNDSFRKDNAGLDFSGSFKNSYRKSTVLCYQLIVKKVKEEKITGNLFSYHLALITICHAFNKIFEDEKSLRMIFEDFFKAYGNKQKEINYLRLKAFMAECTAGQLNAITKEIILKYFQKTK